MAGGGVFWLVEHAACVVMGHVYAVVSEYWEERHQVLNGVLGVGLVARGPMPFSDT